MMRRQSRQRGVSLIEAVVALGVMAFGMLALVGVQATLRGSGDLARQRTEAMRIAQETMESYRAYNALAGTAGELDFAEITTITRTAFVPTGTVLENRLNTTFYTTITSPTVSNTAAMKPVAVTVDWTDRAGQFQAVELRSVIAGVPPEQAGSLALPPSRDPFAAPLGRHRNVPLTAFALPGTSLSVFKPPQHATGTVGWVFNNTTGLITGLCTLDAAITNESFGSDPAPAEACATNSTATTGQLVSGHVRFASGDPSANTQAELPTGAVLNLSMDFDLTSSGHPSPEAECFDDAPRTTSEATARADSQVVYYCIVYSNTDGTFAGRTRVDPRRLDFAGSPWTIADSGAGNYKVCRYTPPETSTRNVDHPLDYTTAGSAPFTGLLNQNFLVIDAAYSCPAEARTTGDLFNANTALHQDGSFTYDNP